MRGKRIAVSVSTAIAVVGMVAAVLGGCGEPASPGDPVASEAASGPSAASASADGSSPGAASASPVAGVAPDRSAAPELVFSDPEFVFELRRTMSGIYAGEADLGECLATARRIEDGDFESWYREWHRTGMHFHTIAERALRAGRAVTAREAYYRAATYLRTAEFFLHGDPSDPRILATWRLGRDAFIAAAELDTVPFERVRIPYGDTALPGYFYTSTSPVPGAGPGDGDAAGSESASSPAAASGAAGSESAASSQTGSGAAGSEGAGAGRRPLLIVQTGFDGCQEELHPYALAALERGYHVLTFEGPGQGQVIRVQRLTFRADWEHVVGPVLDYAVGRPEVDPDRIALWGISLGGYLAPRAAAHDHRIAALIADGAIFDVGRGLLGGLKKAKVVPPSTTQRELQEYLRGDPPEFNESIRSAMRQNTTARWQNEHGMYVLGAGSPALFWAAYMDFTMQGAAEKIRCPTLVCYGESDAFDPGGREAKLLYRHLTCPKTLMRFDDRYEAGDHCQLGALALSLARKLDWLDETLAAARR